MRRSGSQGVAEEFWRKAGGRARFGRPPAMEAAVSVALPVAIVKVDRLDTSTVAAFLLRTRSEPWLVGKERPLRGCLAADAGHAIIFVEKSDPEDEQRFTIAHELAHLLLHYLSPRQEALDHFGPKFSPVLDRLRPPTYGERMSAAMSGVPIEPFRHAMERNTSGASTAVQMIEADADDLAVEILAPWPELRRLGDASPASIRQEFGLPASVAGRLATLIAPPDISEGVIGLFRRK